MQPDTPSVSDFASIRIDIERTQALIDAARATLDLERRVQALERVVRTLMSELECSKNSDFGNVCERVSCCSER